MPITLTQPFQADGKDYPYVAVQMIVSPDPAGPTVVARTVINFRPFRMGDDGNVEMRPHGEMPSILLADAFHAAQFDPHLAVALGAIQDAIQQYVTDKGL